MWVHCHSTLYLKKDAWYEPEMRRQGKCSSCLSLLFLTLLPILPIPHCLTLISYSTSKFIVFQCPYSFLDLKSHHCLLVHSQVQNLHFSSFMWKSCSFISQMNSGALLTEKYLCFYLYSTLCFFSRVMLLKIKIWIKQEQNKTESKQAERKQSWITHRLSFKKHCYGC